MKKLYSLVAFISLLLPLQGQNITGLELLATYTADEITAEAGITAIYDVDLYKVLYTSRDLEGRTDTLSGLIGLPLTENTAHPLLVYSHGTVGSREAVPSRLSSESLISLLGGALGYIAIAPDLLGLGDSNAPVHPYLHAASEAWASYDMIRAIREEVKDYGILTNEQNFISGYSQGGHTAMALHRYMELEGPDGYEVTASAPSSGPYDLSGVTRSYLLSDEEYTVVAYLVNIALSFQAVYGNILSEEGLSSLFKDEYVPSMQRFADGEIGLFELNDILIDLLVTNHGTAVAKLMIKEDRLESIINDPQDPLNLALKDNDVYDWAPQAPTRLYYCEGDDQVIYTNSLVAENAMRQNGAAEVFATNLGSNLNHTECVPNALSLTIFFFNEYMQLTTSSDDVSLPVTSSLYPNPAQDHLILQDEGQSGQVIVTDISGRAVIITPYRDGELLDIGFLPAGMYVVTWKTDKKTETHQLIKR